MTNLPHGQHLPMEAKYGIEAPESVQEKLKKAKVQEYKTRIARLEADIQDIMHKQVSLLEAEKEMCELKLKQLEAIDIGANSND